MFCFIEEEDIFFAVVVDAKIFWIAIYGYHRALWDFV
jgi:hypothetical protein